MNSDIGTGGFSLDPAAAYGDGPSTGAFATIGQNVFGGLYRYDDNLREVPDLAADMPTLSADGLVYTFHIRPDARFSNGDRVRAADLVYSWNRAAAAHPEEFVVPPPIQGFQEVSQHQATTLKGVSELDDQTLVVRLTEPAGWWLTQLWLPSYWVVDQRVIQALGEESWWGTPNGLVGTGPFRMTRREPGKSIDFEPIANWWGGSTGRLQHVRILIIGNPADVLKRYDQGSLDALSLPTGTSDLTYYVSGGRSRDLVPARSLWTSWIGFDFKSGPFQGVIEGLDGRRALSLSIDRKKLAEAVCGQACEPATGGLLPKGVHGYLGDGQDPNAQFDPAKAKTLYKHWDPDGSRIKGVTYAYNFNPFNERTAENLRSQWKANLGVEVQLEPTGDFSQFAADRGAGRYAMFRGGFASDYDSPAEWLNSDGPYGDQLGGYTNAKVEALTHAANALTPTDALSDYVTAERMLTTDASYVALFYVRDVTLVKPYVRGAGSNGFIDHPWKEVEILNH